MNRALVIALALAGCRMDPFELSATVDPEVSTVVELSWSTADPGVSWVEFGVTPERELLAPASGEPGTEHHHLLLGLPPLTTVYYRAVTEIDGRELGVEGQIDTLGIPSTFPDFEVTTLDADRMSSEPMVMGLLIGVSSAAFIANRQGEVLWYRELSPTIAEDATYYGDLQFALDSNHLVFNQFIAERDDPDDLGRIIRVDLGGELVDERITPLAHHAFAQVGDGAYAYVQADIRPYTFPDSSEEQDVAGDAIVVVDQDGNAETVWSSWDWSAPEIELEYGAFYTDTVDWTHANGLNWYPDDQSFLLSAGYIRSVLEVDATSGTVLRHFGPDGDVPVHPDSPAFYFQHDPHWTDHGTLLMTSAYGASDYDLNQSDFIAVEYGLVDGQLVEAWSWGKTLGLGTLPEGQAMRLSNGNTLVNMGFKGQCVEITPEGEVVWEMSSAMGSAFVRVRPVNDLYAGY